MLEDEQPEPVSVKPVPAKKQRKTFLNDLVDALQKAGWGKIKINSTCYYKESDIQFWSYTLKRKLGVLKRETVAVMFEGPEKNNRTMYTQLPGVYQHVQNVIAKHNYKTSVIEKLKVKK